MDLLRDLLKLLVRRFAYRYAYKRVRRSALLLYLRALQATRQSLMAALLVFFVLQLMVFGFLGAIVTAVWLWPETTLEAKLYTLLGTFSALFLIPLAGLFVVFSERLWYRASGAQQLLED